MEQLCFEFTLWSFDGSINQSINQSKPIDDSACRTNYIHRTENASYGGWGTQVWYEEGKGDQYHAASYAAPFSLPRPVLQLRRAHGSRSAS